MRESERSSTQDAFMASKVRILVATIAFGMGVDKSNVRNIVHYDLPGSLESYSQEIGRAGRDDAESQRVLYLRAEDVYLRECLVRGELPSKASFTELLSEILSSQSPSGPGSFIGVDQSIQSEQYDILAILQA